MTRFKRQDYFRHKRPKKSWRRPKGRQSKMRKQKSGSGPLPRIGYGSPKIERGMIDKKKVIVISNPNELEKLDNSYSIFISSGVGKKKTKIIFEKAKEKEIKVLNMKKVKASLKKEKELKKKKETKKKEEKKKEEKAPKKEEKKVEKKEKEIDDAKHRHSVQEVF